MRLPGRSGEPTASLVFAGVEAEGADTEAGVRKHDDGRVSERNVEAAPGAAPPVIARSRLAALVFVFFTAVGLANAVQVYLANAAGGEPMTWPAALVHSLPFWWVKAALIPLVALAVRRLPPMEAGWWWRVPLHLVFSLLFAATPLVLGGLLIVALYPATGSVDFVLTALFSSFFVVGASIYWLLVAAVHALDYYERYRDREIEAARLAQRSARLEASLTSARLDTLRMQLNPHFLYNTLNSVSVLALRGEGRRVARMLEELAGVLRITLERTDEMVSLDDELDLVDRYLRIEQIRFGDRLRVRRRIDPAARDAQIPNLLLQPLVENALKHGVGRMPGPVEVELGARVAGDRLTVWVADEGPGFESDPDAGAGLGLRNTRLRLEALYGDAAELSISSPGRGAQAELTLPYRPFGTDATGRRRAAAVGIGGSP